MNSDDIQADYNGNATPHLRLVTTGSQKAAGYQPKRKIDDIRGISTVKRNLQEIIEGVRNVGQNPSGWPGGVLFYGPAGCGKVFSAEVIASELHAEMYLFDTSAGWDRKTFEQEVHAATMARPDSLTTLHFENVDAPAAESLRTKTLLEILDTASERRNVVITASAILPWHASTELVKQGRLGRVLLVLPPDPPSRALFILERVQGIAEISDDDLEWVVQHTEGHTFHDLQAFLDLATRIAAERQTVDTPTLDRDALRAARRDVGPSSAQWLSQAGHHALMNKEGGLYDDLLQYFQVRHDRH